MTYFQIFIRFVDKSELKKNKVKKELGRLLGGVANRPTVGPNKNLSRIFPPEWPESSTKSLQHCCLVCVCLQQRRPHSPKYVINRDTDNYLFAAQRFNRFHSSFQVAVSCAVSASFPAYGRN
jgi:hypothetical protein